MFMALFLMILITLREFFLNISMSFTLLLLQAGTTSDLLYGFNTTLSDSDVFMLNQGFTEKDVVSPDKMAMDWASQSDGVTIFTRAIRGLLERKLRGFFWIFSKMLFLLALLTIPLLL